MKLLLQYGSNVSDRNVGGLRALDMAKEKDIKELLLTFTASSVIHEQPSDSPVQHRRAGEPPSTLSAGPQSVHILSVEMMGSEP